MDNYYIHPAALVESDHIGKGTRVWAFAHVLKGARVGANCNIGDHAFIESDAVVGNNVTIKNNVCIWTGVTLEDDVFVGPNATFTNDRHPRSPRSEPMSQRYSSPAGWLLPTVVERGVSIGANATVLPGLRLGRFSMIAAGAVVTSDVPPFAMMVGVPARYVADLCRCGNKLTGSYRTTTCQLCGETAELRCQILETETIAS